MDGIAVSDDEAGTTEDAVPSPMEFKLSVFLDVDDDAVAGALVFRLFVVLLLAVACCFEERCRGGVAAAGVVVVDDITDGNGNGGKNDQRNALYNAWNRVQP